MKTNNYLKQLLDRYYFNQKKLGQIKNNDNHSNAYAVQSEIQKGPNQMTISNLEKMIMLYKSKLNLNSKHNAEKYYSNTIPDTNDNTINSKQLLGIFNKNYLKPKFNCSNTMSSSIPNDPLNLNNHLIVENTPIVTNRKMLSLRNTLDNNNNKDTKSKEAQLLQTSDETSFLVKSIDDKIRDLKLQLLHETFLNFDKLSYYSSTITTLLSFLNSNDIRELFYSFKLIKQTLNDIMRNNCFKHIINPFSQLYGKNFTITNKSLMLVNSPKGFNINCAIQCKINLRKQYKNETIELSNRFSVIQDLPKREYKNVYRFDYHYDNKTTVYWIMKEDTYFNYDSFPKAYVMPIVPLNLNDSFHITVNLLSGIGLIDFHSFKWGNLVTKKRKSTLKIENVNYRSNPEWTQPGYQLPDHDLSHYCELELLKTKWLDYYQKNNLPEAVQCEIDNYLTPLKEALTICKLEYDDVGYIIVKINALAVKTGELQLPNLGIKLIIKAQSAPILNEIRKNGLLYEMSNVIEIREGNHLIVYLSLNKSIEVVHTIIY